MITPVPDSTSKSSVSNPLPPQAAERPNAPKATDAPQGRRGIQWKKVLPRVGAVLFAIGITLGIFFMGDLVARFARFGLLGVFLISLLGNATLILPAPSLAVVFAMGGVLPAWQVGLAAGLGSALGEMTGYVAGYAGSAVIEDRERFEKINNYMRRYGMVPIFILAIIPNPFFDLAGISAGVLKMPLWRFLIACWAGKTIKTLAVAFAGAGALPFLKGLITGSV